VYSHISKEEIYLDSITIADEQIEIDYTSFVAPELISDDMGYYRNIIIQEYENELLKKTERRASAIGESIINSFGRSISVRDTMEMSFIAQSLADFLYLTNHEHAGGAPGIFGTNGGLPTGGSGGTTRNPDWRGKPCFSSQDAIGNLVELPVGFVQSNDPVVICNSTSTNIPLFKNTVYMTKADEAYEDSDFNTENVQPGDMIFPEFSNGNNEQWDDTAGHYRGEGGPPEHINYEENDKVCFPIKGHSNTIRHADITVDASRLLKRSENPNTGERDQLIMTDIEFLENGGFRIQEFWYLLPPYQKASAGDDNEDGVMDDMDERIIQMPWTLEGVDTNIPTDTETAGECAGTDITDCQQYNQALEDFHGKTVKAEAGGFMSNDYEEQYMLTDPVSYNAWNYNQGVPNDYGPKELNDTIRVDANGYGVTNLSHYDPENFWRYFSNQNATWEDHTMRFGPTETSHYYTGTLLNDTIYPNEEAVIHIRGGPVRVHGIFNGRYTVVTSGFDAIDGNINAQYEGWSTYYRDAWISIMAQGTSTNDDRSSNWTGFPVDTVFSNIWITGDLTNADAPSNGGPPQPDTMDADGNIICEYEAIGDCGGSRNILGLLSSANVIIANSPDNRGVGPANLGVKIHASVVALNESFVMHYWQHTVNDNSAANWDGPPLCDGRGKEIYNISNGTADFRGDVEFWGGIIQNYRGYMRRSATGPYQTQSATNLIGMDKDYYFDQNLLGSPPFFPSAATCPDEGIPTLPISMVSYQPVTTNVKTIYESLD
jgi:hypothetical protein